MAPFSWFQDIVTHFVVELPVFNHDGVAGMVSKGTIIIKVIPDATEENPLDPAEFVALI